MFNMRQPFSTCSIHLGSSEGTENEGTSDVNRGRQKQPMNRGWDRPTEACSSCFMPCG